MRNKYFTVLLHPDTGEEREVKNGYSWTVLIFGIFALLVRRQWRASIIAFGIIVFNFFLSLSVGLNLPAIFYLIGWGIYAAVANSQLVESLLNRGYEVSNEINRDDFYVNDDDVGVDDITTQSSIEGE